MEHGKNNLVDEARLDNPLFDTFSYSGADAPPEEEDPNIVPLPDGDQFNVASLGPVFRRGVKQAIEKTKKNIVNVDPDALAEEILGVEGEIKAVEAGEKKAVNINYEYLDSPDKLNYVIKTIAEAMPEEVQSARRGTRTHEMTMQAAKELGVDHILEREKGQAWNAEQLLAARMVLVDLRNRADELASKIKSGAATDEEKVAFSQTLSTMAAVQLQIHGAAAEAGRALNQFRIIAKSGELRAQEIKDILASANGKDADRIAEMYLSLDTPEKKNKFAKKVWQAKGIDMILEYWINALLSSPMTHAVNVISNSVVALMQVPERVGAAVISNVFQGGQGVKYGEAGAQLWGMYRGAVDGFRVAGKVMMGAEPDTLTKVEARTQEAITADNVKQILQGNMEVINKIAGRQVVDPQRLELAAPLSSGIDLLGKIVRTPTRALSAEDEFFKSVAYRMELNALAYRRAMEKGLKGEDAARFIAETLENPPDDLHLKAMNQARYQTFTAPLGPTANLQRLVASFPLARFVLPFIRTPVNILKYSFERTPLAVLSGEFRGKLMSADPAERALAWSRLSLGSMAAMSMIGLVAENYDCSGKRLCITGAPPADKAGRLALKRMGWKPYSIKVGDKFYPYNRFDPIGQLLGIMADSVRVFRGLEYDQAEHYAAGLIMAISNNIINKTYLQGLAEAIEVITSYDENQWARWAQRMAGSFVPAIVRRGEAVVDPDYRETFDPEEDALTQWQRQWCANTPGCSEDMPTLRNVWGEPVRPGIWGSPIADFVLPGAPSEWKPTPADEEIWRLKMPFTKASRILDGMRLGLREYDDYIVLIAKTPAPQSLEVMGVDIGGLPLKEAINKIVKSKGYGMLSDGVDPPGGKVLLLRKIYELYKQRGRMMLYAKYPYLMETAAARKRAQLVAAGVPEDEAEEEAMQFLIMLREQVLDYAGEQR